MHCFANLFKGIAKQTDMSTSTFVLTDHKNQSYKAQLLNYEADAVI